MFHMVVYGLGSFAAGISPRDEFVGVFLLEQVDRAVQKYHGRTGRSFFLVSTLNSIILAVVR
jgi:hypothetical protein